MGPTTVSLNGTFSLNNVQNGSSKHSSLLHFINPAFDTLLDLSQQRKLSFKVPRRIERVAWKTSSMVPYRTYPAIVIPLTRPWFCDVAETPPIYWLHQCKKCVWGQMFLSSADRRNSIPGSDLTLMVDAILSGYERAKYRPPRPVECQGKTQTGTEACNGRLPCRAQYLNGLAPKTIPAKHCVNNLERLPCQRSAPIVLHLMRRTP